jgi:hypothetical protein
LDRIFSMLDKCPRKVHRTSLQHSIWNIKRMFHQLMWYIWSDVQQIYFWYGSKIIDWNGGVGGCCWSLLTYWMLWQSVLRHFQGRHCRTYR